MSELGTKRQMFFKYTDRIGDNRLYSYNNSSHNSISDIPLYIKGEANNKIYNGETPHGKDKLFSENNLYNISDNGFSDNIHNSNNNKDNKFKSGNFKEYNFNNSNTGNISFPTLLHLLLICCVSICLPLANAACQTIPVSLSSINYCDGLTCYFTQQVEVDFTPIAGNSACLIFTTLGHNTTNTVSIGLTVSETQYSEDYYYHTDSPRVLSLCDCGCPGLGGSDYSVANCPVPPGWSSGSLGTPYISATTQSSDDCFLIDHGLRSYGTLCQQTAIFGADRFKIQKWKPTARKFLLYQVSNNGDPNHDNFAFVYDGKTMEFDNVNAPFNFTVLSDTITPVYNPVFTIYDKLSPEDLYFFDGTMVNSLSSWNPALMGWLKTDMNFTQHYDSSYQNLITPTVNSCDDNTCYYKYPWQDIEDVLTDNPQALSNNTIEGIYIEDGYFENYIENLNEKSAPNHNTAPYTYLNAGWQLFDSNLEKQYIGITQYEMITPPTSIPTGSVYFPSGTVLNQIGTAYTITGDQFNQGINLARSSFIALDLYNADGTPITNQVQGLIFTLSSSGQNYVCLYYAIGSASNDFFYCSNFVFYTKSWPDYTVKKFTYNGTFVQENLGMTGYKPATLHIPNNGYGNMRFLVSFKNMPVYFKSDLIQPKILSLTSSNNTITITYKSISVNGECILSSSPNYLLLSQTLPLTTQPATQTFAMEATLYSGQGAFTITCAQNTDTKTVSITYNNTPKPPNNQNTSNNTPNHIIDGHNFDVDGDGVLGFFETAVYWLCLPFILGWDLLKTIVYWLFNTKIGVIVLVIIVVIIIGIILIFLGGGKAILKTIGNTIYYAFYAAYWVFKNTLIKAYYFIKNGLHDLKNNVQSKVNVKIVEPIDDTKQIELAREKTAAIRADKKSLKISQNKSPNSSPKLTAVNRMPTSAYSDL